MEDEVKAPSNAVEPESAPVVPAPVSAVPVSDSKEDVVAAEAANAALSVMKKVTPTEALTAAMTPEEVLARPHDYAAWYNGMRMEALNG